MSGVITRRNLVVNPSFELGTGGVSAGSSLVISTSDEVEAAAGSRVLKIEFTHSGSWAQHSVSQSVPAQAGDWVAVALSARRNGVPHSIRLRIDSRDDDGSLSQSWWPHGYRPLENVPLTSDSGVRHVHVAQMGSGTTNAEVRAYFSGSVGSESHEPPPVGAVGYSDAWIACVADTEAEALRMVGGGV